MECLIRRTPSARHLELLARLERRRQLPEVLAPDFLHGDFALEQAYQHLDSPDTQAFVVVDEQGVAMGIFDDYFLSIHTHLDVNPQGFLARLCETHADLESIIVLDLRAQPDHTPQLPLPVSLHAHLSRTELSGLERRLYQIEREGSAIDDPTIRIKNDVLSLIAIASRAHNTLSSQAA